MTKEKRNRHLQLSGWIFFVISSIFFIVASWRSGDWLSLMGGVTFLAANIFFMIAFFNEKNDTV